MKIKMKQKKYKIAQLALVLFLISPGPLFAKGPIGATEGTQIMNNIELAASYAKEAQQYSKQIEQYTTQLKELQELYATNNYLDIARKLFNGGFGDALSDIVSTEVMSSFADLEEAIDLANTIDDFRGMDSGELLDAIADLEVPAVLNRQAIAESDLNESAMTRIENSAARIKALQSKLTDPTLGRNQVLQINAQLTAESAAMDGLIAQDNILRAQLAAEAKATEASRAAAQQALFEKKIEFEQQRAATIRPDDSGRFGVIPSL